MGREHFFTACSAWGAFKSGFASICIQQVIYAYDWCGLPFSLSCCLCLMINTNLVPCHDWGISGISEWQMPSWQIHSTATGAKRPVFKNGTCWQLWKGIIVYHVLLGYLILCFEERFLGWWLRTLTPTHYLLASFTSETCISSPTLMIKSKYSTILCMKL